jgi:hypothetical protein
MDQFPAPLQALDDDRTLLLRCLDALDEERPAVERADLATSTALLGARYENVLADSVYPLLVEALGTRSEIERAELRLQRARETIGAVRGDVHGVAPINAHASDPEGFDGDIDDMVPAVRDVLRFEDAELFPLVERLGPADVDRLAQGVETARAHQTSLPDPPDNAVIRRLAEIKETVGLALNDRSTAWHPGVDAVLDRTK